MICIACWRRRSHTVEPRHILVVEGRCDECGKSLAGSQAIRVEKDGWAAIDEYAEGDWWKLPVKDAA